MEEKKLYMVRTHYITVVDTCEMDVTIVKASSEESAVKKAANLLWSTRSKYVGYGYAQEVHIFEAD